MQVVELYISNTRVDLFKDESVTITDTITNAKDVAKVFTAFSQQFSLPASSTNNQIFKHYYNWDINNGFDARVRVSAILKLNGVDFKKGKVKLNSVAMKDNKAYSYKVVFYGETITLNDILGGDKLSNLDSLDSLNLNYNATNIQSKLQADPSTTDIIAPLITHTKRLYYNSGENLPDTGNLFNHTGSGSHLHGVLFSDLKYAVRIHRIILAIQSQYNINFSNDFFNTTNEPYYNLFMWLHRKSGSVGIGEQLPGFNPQNVTGWSLASGTWGSITNASALTVSSTFQNYINTDTLLQLSVAPSNSTEYTLLIYRDGQLIQLANHTGNVTLSTNQSGGAFGLPNEAAGVYTVGLFVTVATTFNFTWTVRNNDGTGVVTDTFGLTGFSAANAFEFIIKLQTPDITIISFLTGLFKMFNLVAYVKDNGSIYVDTLDNFYATSTTYDITKYIDVNTSSVDVALPYKEIKFGYKGLKTFLASQYEQLNVQQWGTESYSTSLNLDGGTYKVEAPFEHMMFERLLDIQDTSGQTITTAQWGYSVNDNQQSYIGSPLLFYPILQSGAGTTTIVFLSSPTVKVPLTSYIVPSNSVALSAATSTANINFSNEFNEYTTTNDFTGTLYQNYYSTYIENLFKENSRLVKYTAFLPLSIILNYTLADVLVINGQQFRINSLNINLTNNKSQIELITI